MSNDNTSSISNISNGEGVRCPVFGQRSDKFATGGCGFAFLLQQRLPSSPTQAVTPLELHTQDQKALTDLLLPSPPQTEDTLHLSNADSLNPTDDEVLATALGAPARAVLLRAELTGPRTGWRDGHLSTEHGFCPPDPDASPRALAQSPGRVWGQLCDELSHHVSQGRAREAILNLPDVDPSCIPDDALWGAVVCLGILAHTYRYEDKYNGHEGVTRQCPHNPMTAKDENEDPETRGLPRNIAHPYRILSGRLGRPLPHLTPFDLSLNNYTIRDHNSTTPYLERSENMDLRWSAFKDRSEAIFLLSFTEFHGLAKPVVEIMVRCQEFVMLKDNERLLHELLKLKAIVEQFNTAFHKVNLNSNSDQFSSAIEWGQKYAKFSFPLSPRVPTNSGMHLPLFHVMDAFLGRREYSSFLGEDAMHLRKWLPFNIRAFVVAVEQYYQVPDYVLTSGDPRLIGVLKGIVEAYTGERGFMGVHRYKVFGFLEVVVKSGRSETNSGSGAASIDYRPWEEVHKSLSHAMKERLAPYDGIMKEPHEIRGTFEECRFRARIAGREYVDNDPERRTAKVTIDISNSGLTVLPGDRLTLMPKNNSMEVEKIVCALDFYSILDNPVALVGGWEEYWRHMFHVYRENRPSKLTVRELLYNGNLSPLSKELIKKVQSMLPNSSLTIVELLQSDLWPIQASLGDILLEIRNEMPPDTWSRTFPLADLSWLPHLIPIQVPRTYNISNFSRSSLPSFLDLTVTRSEHKAHPLFQANYLHGLRIGDSSGFLNPPPLTAFESDDPTKNDVMIGVSRPFHFQLPPTPSTPLVMFAGGSGIAPFRSFWQARKASRSYGRNILFLGFQCRKRFLYESEIRQNVRDGLLEVHIAFSRDERGVVYDPISRELIEKPMKLRRIDSLIMEQSSDICKVIAPLEMGGLAGFIYICGSTSLYETVWQTLQRLGRKQNGATILSRAFAEGRVMLDVFTTPQPISTKLPVITLSQLAQRTGHKEGVRLWIGVHGYVYDVTDFSPIHPGGRLIIGTSAGLDASNTFDLVAHTNNGEVRGLLSKYLIGSLAPAPQHLTESLQDLRNIWIIYLRTAVESLTTISLEVETLQNDKIWVKDGQLDIFDKIYGKLRLPDSANQHDLTTFLSQTQKSHAGAKVKDDIASLGEIICNCCPTSYSAELGTSLPQYASIVSQQEVEFLEEVREEIGNGLDAFDSFNSESCEDGIPQSDVGQISMILHSTLRRMIESLEQFYLNRSKYQWMDREEGKGQSESDV